MEKETNYQENILAFLAQIVQKNTRTYPEDFDLDAKKLWDSAQDPNMENRAFYWMSRPHGTWCVREREVFLDDTNANCIWTHYAAYPDGILAYRIVVEGIRDGKLAGKVIPIDYAKQVRRVMRSVLPVATIQYRDKNEHFCEDSYSAFMNSTHLRMEFTTSAMCRKAKRSCSGSSRWSIGWNRKISACTGRSALRRSGKRTAPLAALI